LTTQRKREKKKKKAVALEEAEEAEVEAPKEKKKKKKAEAAPAEEEEDEVAELEKPRKKKKKADKETTEEADPVNGESTKQKKRKKSELAEEDDDDAAPTESKEVATKASSDAPKDTEGEQLTVFIGGIPWSCSEDTLQKDFAECGEIEQLRMPMNDEGRPRGIAFIKYTNKAGVDAALKFDGDDYGGRTLRVSIAGAKGSGKGEKGKGDKGKGKGNPEFEIFVRNLGSDAQDETVKAAFAECGDVESMRMPRWDDGGAKGIAFICFKTKDAFEKALEMDGTNDWNVQKAGQGKGKDGKGKDGKGKGKDSKGKGKDGKGKSKGKGKMSGDKVAARDGAMVESTGTKQTFDSDDEE